AAFPQSQISLSQSAANLFSAFPDPTASLTDAQYSTRFRQFVGTQMKILAMNMGSPGASQISVPLLSDTAAFQSVPISVLLVLATIFAIFTPVFGALIILADLLKLGKTSDALLRSMVRSLNPADRWLDDIAEYAVASYASHNSEWDLVPVKFGEDRRTRQDPVGRLRFGGRKEVVQFKNGRRFQ
ncbi:hypothetical protein HDU91_003098, partial [Kappamyces sp. JEL0680]